MLAQPHARAASESPWLRWFALVFGAFLGLAFLKFPNPPVLEHLSTTPTNIFEWLLVSWPVRFAYPCVALLLLAGCPLVRWPGRVPVWLAVVPLLWLGWIWLSATHSINPQLSRLNTVHFTIGIICFYLGLLVVGRVQRPEWFFGLMALALGYVFLAGWQQHFGGLQETRDFAYAYGYLPPADEYPELAKRLESNRIFSTLFYPNSLAGLLLLLIPVVLALVVDARDRLALGARGLVAGLVLVGGISCLFWSGSKAGWLIALGGVAVTLLRVRLPRLVRVGIVCVIVLAGLTGFVVKYLGFFQRGATSVVARWDYWSVAVKNVQAHPWFGTGPGTFVTVYQQLKPPDAEMTRLVHNDYLQQASDSGVVAAVLFLATVGWVAWCAMATWRTKGWLRYGVGLGLVLFALQSLVEFGFYIPATSWCWFGLAGWLIARSALGFDKRPASP